MKHLFLAACLLAVTVDAQTRTGTVTGTWQSDVRHDWTQDNERLVSVQLERDGSHNGFGIPERAAPALADRRADGPVHFTLQRDAGRFDLEGRVSN